MQKIGRYHVIEEIARGGMGVVYRGRHESLHRDVAIKVLLSGRGATDLQRKRFLREAKAISRLSHPRIVQVHAIEEQDGTLYMVLDFVDGGSLQDALDEHGPLPAGRAIEITKKLALALDYAHRHGILHRDLKPANVLLDRDGEPRLTDFGLAKDLLPSASQSLSVRGRFMGTPGYWPPEQARGQLDEVGPRSDVYGLGATLYAMLTGSPPHGEPESLVGAVAALDREPEPPSKLAPAVDPDLDAVVLRCLALEPEQRFASMAELARALDGEVVDLPGSGLPVALLASLVLVIVGLLAAIAVVVSTTPAGGTQAALSPASPTELVEAAPSSTPAETPSEPTAPAPPQRVISAEARDAFDRGSAHAATGGWDAARRAFSEAILLEPDYANAYLNRGAAHANLGDDQSAIEDFTDAIRLNPDVASAYAGRSEMRYMSGDYRGAIDDSTDAIRLNPNVASTCFNRGVARGQIGDYRSAIEDYTHAIRLDPYDAKKYQNRGFVRGLVGDYRSAIEDYTAAIRLNPNDARAYVVRAAPRETLGDYQGAIGDWERSLKIEPNAERAQEARGYLQRARQKLATQQSGQE